jgi:tetraacyldisaccharide 4'-kinase
MKPGREAHRLARWLWQSRHLGARAARALLLPLSAVYGVVMIVRALAYRAGVLKARRLPLPAVAVGNRGVGGAGKTPFASWIAGFYAERARVPGILLRGYGRDEPHVHERLVPGVVVAPDPDRIAGAARALARGAEVLVLDDAFQTLAVARDLDIVLVSAESARQVSWVLPAGPWREPAVALRRADCIVVTRKRASADEARSVADRLARRWRATPVAVAHLTLTHLEGMLSGLREELGVLRGRRVLAVVGIADPESFAVQVRSLGASVQLVAYQDHHPYGEADVQRIVQAQAEADYVVVTEKDAVKLRHRWPTDAREPLVAVLAVRWEHNREAIVRALETLRVAARSS